MSHYMKKCVTCDTIIAQCRCGDKNKTILWGTCPECEAKRIRAELSNPPPFVLDTP